MGSSVALLCPLGCSDEEDPVVCTTDVPWSVIVTVVDASGAPVPDADVRFSVGGAPQPCENMLQGLYGCGMDTRGNFAIEAARGAESAAAAVEVDADECHVITQQLEITLEPG